MLKKINRKWIIIVAIAVICTVLIGLSFFVLSGDWSNERVRNLIIVGIFVSICASLVGAPLVLKRHSFIGIGLSNVSFMGVGLAFVISLSNSLFVTIPLTVLAAVFLLGFGSRTKIKGDAMLAMLAVGALAVGYFLINTFSGQGSGPVCSALFGNSYMLNLTDVWISLAMTVIVVAIFVMFYNRIFAVTFDSNFMRATGSRPGIYEYVLAILIGVVIALSMKAVGSMLIAALIIFPALSAMRVFKSFFSVTVCAVCVSVFCVITGLAMSRLLVNAPPGATIVVVNIVVFALFYLTSLVSRRYL